MKNKLIILLLILSSFNLLTLAQCFDTQRIPIGDPEKKYDFCKVNLNEILNTTTMQNIAEAELIELLSQYRIVMVGETHNNQLHHDVQLSVIKGLIESGKKVVLALEMYNPAQNEVLAAWSRGETDKTTFIEQTDYFITWGHNYRYYEAIFNYAREKNIPMYGVNTPRKYASKIGRGGLGALTEEDLAVLSEIDTSNVEHKFFFKVAMQGLDATMPKQFKNIYPAQCLWDSAMGEGAIKAAMEYPNAVIVVLAGSGHVVYNLGIGRIIKDRSDLSFASVVTVDVPDTVEISEMMKIRKSIKKDRKEKEKLEEAKVSDTDIKEKEKKIEKKKEKPVHMAHMPMMAMDATPYKIVIRSLADFLWGKKEMEHPMYPSFGFSIKDKDDKGFSVKRVFPKTIAYENGLRKDDIIISIDGNEFENSVQLRKYLHYKNWDDEITFLFIRENEEMEITFVIKPIEEKD